jgi:hypothetical protein
MDTKSHPNVIRTWSVEERRRKQARAPEAVPRERVEPRRIRKVPPHNKT